MHAFAERPQHCRIHCALVVGAANQQQPSAGTAKTWPELASTRQYTQAGQGVQQSLGKISFLRQQYTCSGMQRATHLYDAFLSVSARLGGQGGVVGGSPPGEEMQVFQQQNAGP